MKEKFFALWERIKAFGDPILPWQLIETQYTESHRAYHNLTHLASGWNDLNTVRSLLELPDRVEFAWFYHDFIYNPHSHRNEEDSALIAHEVATNARLPTTFGNDALLLIMATKHTESAQQRDAKFIVDIDLSILGKSPQEFDAYERGIRSEYSWVDEATFREKRSEILQRFLHRPYIYHTPFFRQRYEQQARENLKRSIAQLRR